MGGVGSGLKSHNPAGELVDQLEEAAFALEEATQKFVLGERLEDEALQEIHAARDTIKELMRRNGYRHLLPERGHS